MKNNKELYRNINISLLIFIICFVISFIRTKFTYIDIFLFTSISGLIVSLILITINTMNFISKIKNIGK